jgi:hypothetical protein
MREQLTTPDFETTPGTEFNSGDAIDMHAGREDLLPLDEVRKRRQREAFERTALGLSEAAAELIPKTPHEKIGVMSVNLTRFRSEAKQDGFDLAA